MGGAYFGHQQKMVIGLAKELGLEFYNVPDHGKTTLKYKVGKSIFSSNNDVYLYLSVVQGGSTFVWVSR